MPKDADGTPWNEKQWERCFRESDVRSAKFGELLETFMNDPNCEEIISKEMGWDKDVEEDEDEEEYGDFDPEEILAAAESVDMEEFKEEERKQKEELKAIPAYGLGKAFADRIENAFKKLPKKLREDDEDVSEAWINAHIVVAKLVGAHSMGYEDDVICGNIVKCKHSLAGAVECLAALERLRERGILSASASEDLIAECKQVRAAVEDHIADMRSRVWWQ